MGGEREWEKGLKVGRGVGIGSEWRNDSERWVGREWETGVKVGKGE